MGGQAVRPKEIKKQAWFTCVLTDVSFISCLSIVVAGNRNIDLKIKPQTNSKSSVRFEVTVFKFFLWGAVGGDSIYNEIWWVVYSEAGIGCGGEAQTGHVLLHLLLTDVRLDVKPLTHAVEQGSGLREGNVQM